MNSKTLYAPALATALMVLLATSSWAGGSSMQTVNLKDLKDGETKVVGEGDGKVTATRHGDGVHLVIEGKDGTKKELDVDVAGSDTAVVKVDGGEGHRKIMIRSVGEGTEDRNAFVFASGDGDDAGLFAMDTSGEGFSWVEDGSDAGVHVVTIGADDKQTLRCPEGDTIMRVDKDEANATYLCPKHNKVLEKVEGHGAGMRTVIVKEIEKKEEK